MVAQILPSLSLPTNIKTETFSYLVPSNLEDKIKIGQFVEINFRNKKAQGIVLEILKENIEIKGIKEINRIIQSNIIITSTQLDIINFISENCYVSKSKALKTVIPEMPKNNSKKA
ncbi:MAG: hypothetical protein QMB51_03870 [Patescibacteria group bacterium]